jgi:hypothetical protein
MSNTKHNDFIAKNFSYFKEIYNDKEEMFQCFKRFQDIYDDSESENAESDFVALHEFYKAMTRMEDQTVKLLMIISLIEKLSSEREYLVFPEWLKKTEQSTDKNYNVLWNEYNEKFGCSGKFRRFFGNEEYVNRDEQINLLRSVSAFRRKGNSYVFTHPFCYEEKCPTVPSESGTCPGRKEEKQQQVLYECDYKKCPLPTDDRKLKNGISQFAEYLYEVRSRFVHGAVLPNLPSGKKTLFSHGDNMITMREYRFRKSGGRAKILRVFFNLGPKQLEDILNRNFMKLLDAYIKNNLVRDSVVDR